MQAGAISVFIRRDNKDFWVTGVRKLPLIHSKGKLPIQQRTMYKCRQVS
jgi:hypothetical protein